MSDDDYKMGQQGLRYDRTMNRQDYDKGKADAADQASVLANTKTSVDGAGIGLLFMAPILAVMYPIAGGLTVAGVLLAVKLTDLVPKIPGGWQVVFVIVAGIASLWLALKVEHKASESKIYRHVRHVFRLIWAGTATFGAMTGMRPGRDLRAVMDHAPPSTLFVCLLAIGLMAWLGPKFDRLFFPVRDAYVIKQEVKYAGMSDLEIDEQKHRDSRARFRFFWTWVGGSVLLVMVVPYASVALMLALFIVLWIFRKRLFAVKVAAG